MKQLLTYTIFLFILFGLLIISCQKDEVDEGFYPEANLTIAGYLEEKQDSLNAFYSLLKGLNYLPALTAYNPAGNGYTVFLPSDDAFARFFEESEDFGSMEDLLADHEYAVSLALYHIVATGIVTSDFPFGSLPDTTATGDYLTVSVDTTSQQPLVNGLAQITLPNIELTNGYIHHIDRVLIPITYHIADWIQDQERHTIFADALYLTGLDQVLSGEEYYTLLIETDQVFNEAGISSVDELAERFSGGQDDYTSEENGLYRFVAYHIIDGVYYLDDFEGSAVLYNTNTLYPLSIDGESLVIKINEGVMNFDTVVSNLDTTIIDYIGFNYEQSNNQAVNGAVHIVDQVMELFLPERTDVINQFFNEPAINDIRNDPGETVFTTQEDFQVMSWTGTEELTYIKSEEAINGVWNNDYIILEGSFSFTYEIPRLLPGKYNFYIAAHAFNDNNASIQLSIDGNEIGGNIDLTSGGTSNSPYFNYFVATLDFSEYRAHEIEVVTLIPGTLMLDRFTLEPADL